MSDYIKRKEAIQIAWCYVDDRGAIDELNGLPKADVVEVVRCKDCKWWDNDGDAERCTHKYGGMWAKSDAYCSYGERTEP